MKVMKKFTVLAVVVMIIGLMFTINVSKGAVEDVQGKIKVSDVSGKAGESVTVKVIATSDIALDNDSLLLEFNKNKLKYEKSSMASVQDTMIMGGNRENHASGADGFAIALTSTVADKSIIKAGTELATITFKILEGTKESQTLTLVHYKGQTRVELTEGIITIETNSDAPTTPSEPNTPSNPDNPGTVPPSDNPQDPNIPNPPSQDNETKQEKIVYEMLEGKDSVWKNGSGQNLRFRSSADFSKFLSVAIDGNIVDKSYYIAKSGSTIIEIKESYLKTFKEGTHKISINSEDGSAEANFKVEQTNETNLKPLPKLGDEVNPIIIALFAILVINMGVSLFMYHKMEG